jgi:L-aspartate oxidase
MSKTASISSDVLIIGTGIAGLSLALKLADAYKVVLITKKEAMEANTRYAQGGIASVMSSDDRFESHVTDTLEAGAGLCDRKVVERIVSDGPRLIEELVALGVKFSRHENKKYDLGREGGHSERRILHAGDITGNELQSVLLRQVRSHESIQVIEHQVGINLIREGSQCVGVYALDAKSNHVTTYLSRFTVLATGGAGKVYLYTSNPDVATGDGMAMAYRAGAVMSNLEFVQFHPTCLYNPGGFVKTPGKAARGQSFLLSEALRGEGAILKRIDGTPFMAAYSDQKDLAPRDIVARAIDAEMKKRGDDHVLLDLSHRDGNFIKERFPNIFAACLEFGFDMTAGPIPVVPAAHYFCGGVKTGITGETSIPGLFAIGETACTGLHGANRLASNSLLEAIAMADYASKAISEKFDDIRPTERNIPGWDPSKATASDEAVVISHNWDEIRRLMWNYVGIVRSDNRLKRAQNRIRLLKEEIREYYWNMLVTADLIELRNLADVAEMTIECALRRNESRGLHYNLDHPNLLPEARDTDITMR